MLLRSDCYKQSDRLSITSKKIVWFYIIRVCKE